MLTPSPTVLVSSGVGPDASRTQSVDDVEEAARTPPADTAHTDGAENGGEEDAAPQFHDDWPPPSLWAGNTYAMAYALMRGTDDRLRYGEDDAEQASENDDEEEDAVENAVLDRALVWYVLGWGPRPPSPPRGLSGDALRRAVRAGASSSAVRDGPSNSECPICYEPITLDDTAGSVTHDEQGDREDGPVYGAVAHLAVCGHTYCRSCITRWLEQAHTCPLCVRDVRV